MPPPHLAIPSPKHLYTHLSKYVVGQERAKRILSVAVHNHYQRIAPLLPPVSEQEPSPPKPPRPQPPPIILESPIPYPPTSSISYFSGSHPSNFKKKDRSSYKPSDPTSSHWDPSTAGMSPQDPTITHDLLTLRSREGQWARNGYFEPLQPCAPLQTLSGQTTKRQRLTNEHDKPLSNEKPAKFHKGKTYATCNESIGNGPETPDHDDTRVVKGESVIIEKSNVLMIGPTGTGKTLMARTLAQMLNVPFVTCDATSYTQAGYVGEDVENCVLRLLQAANYDVSKAEIGVIHIDEIDKIAKRGGNDVGGGGRDVGGEGVQQALLRLLEGTSLTLSAKAPAISSSTHNSSVSSFPPALGGGMGSASPSNTPKATNRGSFGDPPGWDFNSSSNKGLGGKRSVREGLPGYNSNGGGTPAKGDTFVVDTSNILFVLSGAFVGLEQIINRRIGKGSIGFGAPLPQLTTNFSNQSSPLKGLSTVDLTTYGLIPEFLGRLPILSTLHPLSIDDMVRILVEPNNALLKQYIKLFENYGSELCFTDKAVREIAREGLDRGGGARGLRGVLEEVLLDAMFEVPGSSVRYCLITEAVVRKDCAAHYFSRGQNVAFLEAIEKERLP
ncbi:ATP-dependent Clp protease ATP-binding subunit ClpX [Cryptococcus neoformans]|uniref:ATP-dependent Clp protease ATP-binding subunit ClpX n=1 Tax=Cryptococcus neoformans Tu259-1 TaxID=1230072 RepID=A0A854QD81_CRYNE|nr:ATP-dependent Clp protease ATP-binding subunit ClpX [Cryptococcus neoformans var. grubii AD1-83a]OWZ58374.1 ATP-dependent Clp protease ATP-binding subunit ClpX [Cryptococcus neoformans var. grubii 125.91]OXG22449.1 ATP-dependent Clp protease ATP-binding subunit ClpX [Cryptococcus neoformans var. grubii Tu259-1]OXG50982.1 ATP-dependent Clp protease ATP-binding subunit ClpX [Cryptococcus neoformans var. grubii Th84]OXG61280.1 ATP-dependent Clp protease ATP-binding subunit ClpX [Cryptococcus ne